jgi:cell division protein FtsB
VKWHPSTERQKQDLQIAYAKLLNENARLVAQIFDLNKENKTLRRDLKRALEILTKAKSVK